MTDKLAAVLLVVLMCGAVLVGVAGPARAQDQLDSREAIALENQILELRRDLQAMQDQSAAGGGGGAPIQVAPAANPPTGDLATSLLSRVQSLEDQVRTLTGQVQELQNTVSQQNADMRKRLDDLNFKIGNASGGGGNGGASMAPPLAGADVAPPPVPMDGGGMTAPPPPPAAPTEPPAAAGSPKRTPEMALQEGNAALARHDYTAAGAAAHEVLSGGHSPRQADAAFLLAQSEAGQGKAQQAAVDYYDAYQRAPKGFRAPDALLGVANALLALNDHKSACQALDKMRAEFPAPRSDVREAAAGARGRAGCR